MPSIVLQPMRWSELPHIDDVEPLNANDEQVLDEIRQVLARHGAIDRFGVCLLHNHFEMNEGEYLLESTNDELRTQTITVDAAERPDENTIQTMWKFDNGLIESVTKCVLRCHYFLGHKQRHKTEAH